jgi:hypothetical protein
VTGINGIAASDTVRITRLIRRTADERENTGSMQANAPMR